MNYFEHLKFLESRSPEEINRAITDLINTTPNLQWPDGMPASIDPKLVLIGVSYGNSPSVEIEISYENGGEYFVSTPSVNKTINSHFYYPDTRGYWKKLRYLCFEFCKRNCHDITENQAISLASHFNLGTGSAGLATKKDVEEVYVKWVSSLLNKKHSPDLVVLFGLNSILKDDEICNWWNYESGLKVNWKKPDNIRSFFGYKVKNLVFREWSVTNSNNQSMRLVIWPNHPSRSPFSDYSIWVQSVNEYMDKL
jgi:mRNA-degrading endonuclease HigB of HigAB toxin-antitoxin module